MSGDFPTRTKLRGSFLKVSVPPGVEPREEVVSYFPSQNAAWRRCGGKKRLSVPGLLSLPEAVKLGVFPEGEKALQLTVPVCASVCIKSTQ